MMRQSEFKKKLDPELGRYTRQHIYGEGMMNVFKSVGKKIFGKTMKKAAKKAVTAAATKTGEHVGKKAGDKIVQMLSKGSSRKPPAKKVTFNKNTTIIPNKKLTQQQINARVNSILSGGKII